MNEQIKELIAQATKATELDDADYRHEHFDKEKFAKLIVRRCAAVAYSYDPLEPVPNAIARLIQEHFGIEE